MSANDIQHGGDHYKSKTLQPWDVIIAWDMGFLDGNALKYLARYRSKNGKQDLEKAIHYIQKLIEKEYPEVKAESITANSITADKFSNLGDTIEFVLRAGKTQQDPPKWDDVKPAQHDYRKL